MGDDAPRCGNCDNALVERNMYQLHSGELVCARCHTATGRVRHPSPAERLDAKLAELRRAG
jgi:recombinational DNA repair protein (RecF pathway)